MKKFTTLALAGLVVTSAFAQRPAATKAVASHTQITKSVSSSKSDLLLHDLTSPIVKANQGATSYGIAPNGKTAAVSPIALGSASNAFTILRTEQNQVYADQDLDLVLFIHRNNASVFGGGSGNLRYDISIDGGASFSNDIGDLNPVQTKPARYPQISAYKGSATNPLDARVLWECPSLGSTWDGHITGSGSAVTSGAPANLKENYLFGGERTLLPGGLSESTPGTFWTVDADYDGAATPGDLYLYKGVYNTTTEDIDWTRVDTISPNHFTGFDGTATFIGPNIAFSPDGQTGWISWLGDLAGGIDTTLSPVFMKSTDGGATWGAPVEYNLNSEAWVADSLQSLWVDSTGSPASSGRATTAFDFDMTVDMNGNPHFVTVIGSGTTVASPDPGYSIYSGLAKFLADVTTADGGATWTIKYISPILAFRTQDFGATASTVNMDNYPQVSRSANGDFVFYSWADSDTALVTGNQNGIGFGESDNIAPNLRISGMNVATGEQSYPQLVSDGDLIWEGRILFPTMSPIAVGNGAGCWNLPIVVAEMPAGEPVDPTNFHYFGNDAVVCASSMCTPQSMTLAWDAFAFAGATPPCAVGVKNDVASNVVLGNAFPNPTNGEAVITFELPAVSNISIDLVNVYGQQVAVLANGEFAAGAHKVVANTDKLASGVYFYNLRTNGQVLSKKLVVSK